MFGIVLSMRESEMSLTGAAGAALCPTTPDMVTGYMATAADRPGKRRPEPDEKRRDAALHRSRVAPDAGDGSGMAGTGPAATELAGLTGRSVIVTGAGGTIGGEICARLMTCRPSSVIMVDQGELALSTIQRALAPLARHAGVTLIAALGSCADATFVTDVISANGADIILHAAAYKHVDVVERNARAGIINNTLATALLAQKAREHRVGKFVLISTDKAVRPVSVMGASKRFAELVVQDLAARGSGTVFSVVRFGNVAGSSGSVMPLFRDQIASGGPVTLTDPDATRFFMSVEDAGHLVLAASCMSRGGEVFALDMGPAIRIRDLAVGMIRAAGLTVRDDTDPQGQIEIVTTGLRPGEKLHESRLVRPDRLPTAHPRIFRLPESVLPEFRVAAMLRDLREASDQGSEDALRATIARWVMIDREAAPSTRPGKMPDAPRVNRR